MKTFILFFFFIAISSMAASNQNSLIRKTEAGLVRGFEHDDTRIFKGIPYATPPVGNLRWHSPQPLRAWDGVKKAYYYGNVCAQVSYGGLQAFITGDTEPPKVIGSEDCLTLNLWTPNLKSNSEKLPVMVFIHGGANTTGAASDELFGSNLYDGELLSKNGKAVVVTLNYRLGPLGFLAHPALSKKHKQNASGNYGLMDQIAALRWVQRNIQEFNGDSKRVMIFGESAGALNALILYTTPAAKDLFSRVLLQSTQSLFPFPTLEDAEFKGLNYAAKLGCKDSSNSDCLYSKKMDSIVMGDNSVIGFSPNIDGYLIHETPYDALLSGHQNKMPLIIGANKDELTYLWPELIQQLRLNWPPKNEKELLEHFTHFFPKSTVDKIFKTYKLSEFSSPADYELTVAGDFSMVCPTNRLAKAAHQTQSEPVRQFIFNHTYRDADLGKLKAAHGFELPFVFGSFPSFPYSWYINIRRQEVELSKTIMGYWSRLAANGDPNISNQVYWPAIEKENNAHFNIDEKMSAATGDYHHCEFWNSL